MALRPKLPVPVLLPSSPHNHHDQINTDGRVVVLRGINRGLNHTTRRSLQTQMIRRKPWWYPGDATVHDGARPPEAGAQVRILPGAQPDNQHRSASDLGFQARGRSFYVQLRPALNDSLRVSTPNTRPSRGHVGRYSSASVLADGDLVTPVDALRVDLEWHYLQSGPPTGVNLRPIQRCRSPSVAG